MNDYSDLKNKLNELPKGYISKKKINNKTRYYLQYRDGNRIVSKYIKEEEIKKIQSQLLERKVIENKINDLLANKKTIRKLKENALSLSGYVMEEDDVVATFKNNELIDIDYSRSPSLIVKTKELSLWLLKRSIDNHRTNSRMLKKALRIKSNNEIENVLRVNAVSITDNFWFKPLGSKLKYKDVLYDNDFYSETALNGDIVNVPEMTYITPELVNTGSYEKCWKLINNKWYMVKKGNKKEIFAELFSSKLAKLLNIPTATYDLYKGNIITKNFSNDYNLEPISHFAGDDDSYDHVYRVIETIDEKLLDQYLKLIYLDALIDNVDRHNENVSILRKRKTGKIFSLAPNYDNNLALYSLKESGTSNSFGLIKEFEKFIISNKDITNRFINLKINHLNKEQLIIILNEINKEYIMSNVVDFILTRQKELDNFRNNLHR